MAVDVYLENNVTYDSYLEPEIPLSGTIIGQGTAVTSINGISGPTVTFAGGTSGFSFAPGGTTITLVSPLTTKGDLYTHNSTVGIGLPVGADTFILTADSAQTTGMKWAAPATAGTVTHTGTLTANQLILGNGGADVAALGTSGTDHTVLHGNTIGGAPLYSAVDMGNEVAGTLAALNGGTGLATYTIGDMLYAGSTGAFTSLSILTLAATGNALIAGPTTPQWGKIGLTTHVSGTLPVGNGGTGTATAFTAGSVVFAGGSGIYAQDNANLFFDDTNNRLGVGTASPGERLDVVGTIRAAGQNTAPGSGHGIEISHDGTTGYIQSFDRAASDTDLYISGKLVSIVTSTHHLDLSSLPTSSAGLAAGEVWVDTGAANVLKRV